MAYQLKIDEMLDAICNMDHARSAEAVRLVEATADILAGMLADALDIKADGATFQGMGFAGTCVPFYPNHAGQELPQAIAGYDDADEWSPGEAPNEATSEDDGNPFDPESPEGRAWAAGDRSSVGQGG